MWTSTSRPKPVPNRARSAAGAPARAVRTERIAAMPAGLAQRSGGTCEIQLAGCLVRASELHLRTRRTHNRLSALLHTCPACARGCEKDMAGARKLGLVLRGRQDPARVKLLYRSEMALLTDAGDVVTEAAAAGLPIGSLIHRLRPKLPPWLIAAGTISAAAACHSGGVPAWACAAGTLLETAAVWAVAPRLLRRGHDEMPDRAQRTAAKRRRVATWIALGAGAWLTQADLTGLGVDFWADLTWTEAAALFAVAAPPWFSYVRVRPQAPAVESVADTTASPVEEYEQLVRTRWDESIAQPGGKGAGTSLEAWRRVTGGWGATVVAPAGSAFDFGKDEVRRAIAQAYKVGITAVSLEIDTDNDSQAFLLVQRQNPLKEVVRWAGPPSVNPHTGRAVVGRYIDGTPVPYEVYRPEFGCPHVGIFGTTGSGKSEFLNLILTIERWAHYTDADGAPHGMVASLLIDPQQGQSFGPFLDDLAAPVASSLDEAMLLVKALDREMLRRNAYLANVEWVDDKGRRRKGRKWWNPLVDGPILDLTIDEAHDYLSDEQFTGYVTRGGRMWRKCGGRVKIATHTTHLGDLGGSSALRDMISQFVAVFRTNNGHTANGAFNGRLPVDPRKIPEVPGMAYVLTRGSRAMLMRGAWEPDFYDWVRDESDAPIGYPARLPAETLKAFGPEFADWVRVRESGEEWRPGVAAEPVKPVEKPGGREAVLRVLGRDWMQFGKIVEAAGYSTRQCTNVLKKLVGEELVESKDGAYRLVDAS